MKVRRAGFTARTRRGVGTLQGRIDVGESTNESIPPEARHLRELRELAAEIHEHARRYQETREANR